MVSYRRFAVVVRSESLVQDSLLQYIYIYMVAPPCTYPFCTFTCIYGVFCIFWGICFYVLLNKFGNSFEGECHIIYIYITVDVDKLVRHDGSGIKRSQEVLGPHWNQEPRTKIAQKVLGESWFLVPRRSQGTSQFFFLSDYVLSIIHTNVELVCHIVKVEQS